MEICKRYFKIDNDIINGFKIIKEFSEFRIYIYTSCKKLNNWQLFLEYSSLKEVKNYFKKQLCNHLESDNSIEWNLKELEWMKEINNDLEKI